MNRRATRPLRDIKKVSAETSVSPDLQGYMLLRSSGLSRQEQTQVLSSARNKYELKGIEAALRLQHPYAHQYSRERRSPTAYAVEDHEPEDYEEASYDGYGDYEEDEGEELDEDVYAMDTVPECGYEDELGDDTPEAEHVEEHDLEVFATMAQARHGRSAKGGGHGRGRGRSASSVGTTSMLPPSAGSGSARTDDDRTRKLKQLKQKTQCLDCGRFGHWRDDPECNQTSSGSAGPSRGRSHGRSGRDGARGRGSARGRGGRSRTPGRGRPVYCVFNDSCDKSEEKPVAPLWNDRRESKPRWGRDVLRLDDDEPAIHLVEDEALQDKKRWQSIKENLRVMMDEAIGARRKTRATGICRHCDIPSEYSAACNVCGRDFGRDCCMCVGCSVAFRQPISMDCCGCRSTDECPPGYRLLQPEDLAVGKDGKS